MKNVKLRKWLNKYKYEVDDCNKDTHFVVGSLNHSHSIISVSGFMVFVENFEYKWYSLIFSLPKSISQLMQEMSSSWKIIFYLI